MRISTDRRIGIGSDERTLMRLAEATQDACLAELGARETGLSEIEAAVRRPGRDTSGYVARAGVRLRRFAARITSPLNLLLGTLAGVSFWMGEPRAAMLIATMIGLSVGLSSMQEGRATRAVERLRASVHTTARVRRPRGDGFEVAEVPFAQLVCGDVIELAAGDLVPADLRLLQSNGLHAGEAALTGEAMPVEKDAHASVAGDRICWHGSSIVGGSATALVLRAGAATEFGRTRAALEAARPPTEFDRGLRRFTYLLVGLIALTAPTVLLLNGFARGDWLEASFFAIAVAVGMTPEMLPMIVAVNLAFGAVAMSRRKVIVKHPPAIQTFGAMDLLCMDKTGTLTQDRVVLKRHLDAAGADSERVLRLAFLNSHFQSGLRNLLDAAVLAHDELHVELAQAGSWRKLSELPFDFERRRLSVTLADPAGGAMLICKGAVAETLSVCARLELAGDAVALDDAARRRIESLVDRLNDDGFRVVAVATAHAGDAAELGERGLVLVGFIAFLDPPKDDATAALAALRRDGVALKLLTGDSDRVTRAICRQVGFPAERILTGPELARLEAAALDDAVTRYDVFARVTPTQKAAIVAALRRRGFTVGMLGDGLNDAAAMRAADIGISVDSGVDAAKEVADIILLEKSLAVLHDGVRSGRRVFANLTKYLRMGASSSFGNSLSMTAAGLVLPFLPMLPIQLLANNMLYDASQTGLPSDQVDDAQVAAPHRWDLHGVLRFVLVLGPLSSLFDLATFAVLRFGFAADVATFQTCWFQESLLTQVLVVHVIRTERRPFIDSLPSAGLAVSTFGAACAGMVLPLTPIGATLGFVPPPTAWWPAMAAIIAAYLATTALVKRQVDRTVRPPRPSAT